MTGQVRIDSSEFPAPPQSRIHSRNPPHDAVEEKIHEINQATRNAVASLNTNLKTRLVRLPKALKMMPLEELSGAATTKAAATAVENRDATGGKNKPAAAGRKGRAKKNTGGENTAPAGPPPPPKFALPAKFQQRSDSESPDAGREEEPRTSMPSPPVQLFSRAKKRANAAAGAQTTNAAPADAHMSTYNGVPLQTPMPFAGVAVPMPVQMLTVQAHGKRAGGRTKASRNAPQAAVVTTKDGKQWAIGASGLGGIPETHRQEVADMLKSQWAFLQDALRL